MVNTCRVCRTQLLPAVQFIKILKSVYTHKPGQHSVSLQGRVTYILSPQRENIRTSFLQETCYFNPLGEDKKLFCNLHKGAINIAVALKMWAVTHLTSYPLQCLLLRPLMGLRKMVILEFFLLPLLKISSKILLIFISSVSFHSMVTFAFPLV